MAKVCIVRCDSYERDKVRQAVASAFREIGASDFFKPNEKILLKPNILSAKTADQAATTHPEVLYGVATALKGYHAKLSYGDSPALDSPEKASNVCGFDKVAKELSISRADFITPVTRDFPQGVLKRTFTLAKAVDDNDGIVNIAKFKTHALTRFTGAMKNTFGLIPGMLKAKEHVRFQYEGLFVQMLADLNNCVKARLYVMDAIVGMEGNGPANGTPRAVNMILVSDDPVAMDSVCIGLIGLDYRDILTVTTGQSSGVGVADHDRIALCLIEDIGGKETVRWDMADKMIPPLVISNFVNAIDGNPGLTVVKSPIGTFAKKMILNRPVVIHEKCVRCGQCVKICPVEPKAIELSEKKRKIVYHYEKCIRCFCCQETCPYAAIEIKKAPLHFILKG